MTNIAQYTVNLLTNIIDSADKMTIGQMVDEAYLCLLDTSWDLPVRKYTRKAQVVAELQHVISRIGACPVYAERVPDVTLEQRVAHHQNADALRGILRSHGIDPQDWDACLDYIMGNGNMVPRYWVKIYTDYVYEVTPFCPDEGCPHSDTVHYCNAPLVVNSQQAESLRIQGYSGDLSVVDTLPGMVMDTAEVCARSFPSVPGLSDGWHPINSDQQARAVLTQACNVKPEPSNKLPRGKAARRMLSLGWVFNH